MKKMFLTVLLSLATVAGFPCTNLIVGKLASADGSVICTYNCDSFGFLGLVRGREARAGRDARHPRLGSPVPRALRRPG